MNLKVLIIDDEQYIRELLKISINKYFKNELLICGESGTVKDGLRQIKECKPDIVLLDIELEDGVSFEILEALETIDFEIIFITGFDDKAIKAIKLGALDYLLKPIDEDELQQAISKAVSQRKVTRAIIPAKMMNVTTDYYIREKKEHIVLKTQDSIHLIKLDNLIYCRSDGNYTTFYIKEAPSILISKPLKYALELLPEDRFVRCQQSYIVNVGFINRLIKSGSIILHDLTEIPISGTRKEQVMNEIFKKMNV